MRQIIFDTETTGLDPLDGHRLVEIGAVEVFNYIPTGKTYHQFINPERDIPEEVVRIHGIDNDKVKDCPVFSQIVGDFLTFIGDDTLVAHNASFDMRFINHELKKVGMPPVHDDRVVDTLEIARQKFPGSPKTLDALCKRFDVSLDKRTLHGALLDSELLAEVYLELVGGRQQGLHFAANKNKHHASDSSTQNRSATQKQWPERDFSPTPDEQQRHHDATLDLEGSKWSEWFSQAS